MNKKKINRKPAKPFIFSYDIAEIKKQNLFFDIIYSEAGKTETYKELLRWSEIEKPNFETLEIKKIQILKNKKHVYTLYSKKAKALINVMDLYNKKGLNLTKIQPTKAPAEKELIFCVSLYFAIPPKFSIRNNIIFKMYLWQIIEKRNFWEKIAEPNERNIFKYYLKSKDTKRRISVLETGRTNTGVYIINKNLQKLTEEIRKDYENGLLKIQEYKKPPTQREINRKLNECLKSQGIETRVPLRKKSKRELLNQWKKTSEKIRVLADKTDK